jgi:hypothetical protein
MKRTLPLADALPASGIGEFLRIGNAGPEHQSLLRLIGELAH